MKRYLVLLGGGITHDGRVIRCVRSLSRIAEVDLICLDPQPSDEDLFDGPVRIHGVPTSAVRASGLLRRLRIHRHFDVFVEKARSLGRTWDAVHANDYPMLFPASRIVAGTGAKLVYDSHELYLPTVNQFYQPTSVLKRALIPLTVWAARAVGGRVERSLLRDVDLFLTTNESYAEWFREEYGVTGAVVIMNCPTLSDVAPDGRLRRGLGLPAADRIVLYQGVLNPGRGLEELVRSAAGYDEGIRLVIAGRGPDESSLRRAAADLEGRVFFTGMVPYDELLPLTAEADLGVLILDPVNRSKELASANKIFEYMAAGLPVLATDLPENRRAVDGADAGWLLKDREPETIARTVNGIFADPEEMARRAGNGRRAHRERYNWEHEEERLLSVVGELLRT